MIIYNVTVKVSHERKEEWISWMQSNHIPDLLKTGLFVDYAMHELLYVDDEDGKTYVIQYQMESIEHYNKYQKEHAAFFQNESKEKFGEDALAFRTLMQKV